MNGLLILNKPAGKSSHGAVYAVRRMTGEKRIGHAGTLDPLATGVLILCLGQAARVSEYLVGHDKTYRATVHLGIETDTYDATGETIAVHPVEVSAEQITTALHSFLGKSLQRPPAHSAVQRDGVRAYKLARRGIAVEMEPREIEIMSITLRSIQDGGVEFDVRCSKGTYIRSLAHDLGEKLGTGAHLRALTRLASGPFTLEQSVTLEQVERLVAANELERYLIPMDRALTRFPELHLDAARAWGARNGQYVTAPGDLTADIVRAYDESGKLIGLLERDGGRYKPKKIFDANVSSDHEPDADGVD